MARPSNEVLMEHFQKQALINQEAETKVQEEWQKYQDEQTLGVRLAVKLDSILSSRGIRICEISIAGIVGFFTRNVGYGLAAGLATYSVVGLTNNACFRKAENYYVKENEIKRKQECYRLRNNIYNLMVSYLKDGDTVLSEISSFHLFIDFSCASWAENDEVLSSDPLAIMILREMDARINTKFQGKLEALLMAFANITSDDKDTSYQSETIEVPFEDVTDKPDTSDAKTYQYRSNN